MMIYVRDGLSFSNENSTLADALARWLSNRKCKRQAAGKTVRDAETRKRG